jgi:hypothetical protein
MSHIRKDAPNGYVYHRKNTKDDFASTVFIGNGRTEEDYELVKKSEYEAYLAEQEKANAII